jgi:hypothetical protein
VLGVSLLLAADTKSILRFLLQLFIAASATLLHALFEFPALRQETRSRDSKKEKKRKKGLD